MKKLDFEAHFVTRDYVRALENNTGYPHYRVDSDTGRRRLWYTSDVAEPIGDPLLNKLLDLGGKRIENMDLAGIGTQILSLTSPGAEHFEPKVGMEVARRANDALAGAREKYPGRFEGFAALAPRDPEGSRKELERAVKELGLKGWKTHSNYGDSYLDDLQYWPILEKAWELGVPIYLHPTVPSIPQLGKYGFVLSGAPFGFGIDAAICMMRLIYSGVLDRFPGLTFVLGHLGEGLPFLMQRIDFAYVRPYVDKDVRPDLQKKPSDYLKENVFITTSGNYLKPAFVCAVEAMGLERVLLATDYPYEDPVECMAFLEGLPLSQGERDRIYCLNARALGFH
ncbi:MAG: amidohydrolase [Deltaproteobacteria bacterium]|nr:amidohydrolase [Deltaproteobacteria bacterium]